jgi:hypothetical protein
VAVASGHGPSGIGRGRLMDDPASIPSLTHARAFADRVWRGLRRRSDRALRRYLPEGATGGIPNGTLSRKRVELARRRTFGTADLDRLERLLASADEVRPIREIFAAGSERPGRIIALRHDMDHDVENSVRWAEWEAAHGWRATYYVLHTDWYWGASRDRPSRLLAQALHRIASLGHEVGIHNNAIAAALREGGDPVQILERDLAALRGVGLEIVGSARHGDPLCRTLGFVNDSLFVECAEPGTTGRELTYLDPAGGEPHRVRLDPVPMARFGLTHEAYGIGHTLYLSDAGGRWHRPFDDVEATFIAEGGLLQLLVHPVWWALPGERATGGIRPARGSA